MNREEAVDLLVDALRPYREKSYEELSEFLDRENVQRVRGGSGREYVIEISVEYVNETDATLEVTGYASDVGARNTLPPTVNAGFCVAQDNSLSRVYGYPDESA